MKLLHEHQMYAKLLREDGKPFKGWTDFCLTARPFGLGRSPQDIDQIIQEARDPKTIAEKARPLAEHRRPNKEEENKVDNINLKTMGGTSASYLTARIARDAPDVLERMQAGEFTTVAEAERAAGPRFILW